MTLARNHPAAEAGTETHASAYVCRGYIEDRAGERQRAVAWFQKALALDGAGRILSRARRGLEQPVIW